VQFFNWFDEPFPGKSAHESAVKFKNRKRRGRRLILRRRCGHKKKGKDEDKEMRDDAGGRCNWAHELK